MTKTHTGKKTFAIKGHLKGKKFPKKRFNVYAYDYQGALNTAKTRKIVVENCKRIR